MMIKVQITVLSDDGEAEVVAEVAQLRRDELRPADLGLRLEEAKSLLSSIQRTMIEQQASAFSAKQASCQECGQTLRRNGQHKLVMRTVFGKVNLPSPRFYQCRCTGESRQSFSPLAELLPERTSPDLLYLETKWASLMSYGLTLDLLQEVLPVSQDLSTTTIRKKVQSLGERLEGELGEEQGCFIEGGQRDWESLPTPAGPLTVGIDGGYVHGREQKSREAGCFEVIVGKSIPSDGKAKCFAYVSRYDQKPKRRLFEVLQSQGMQMNQQVTFLSDGGDNVRDLQMYLNPQAEHLLDWFHLTMRLTVMGQMAKGLVAERKIAGEPAINDEDDQPLKVEELEKTLESLKWHLWHGNVYRAQQLIEGLEWDLEPAVESSEKAKKLLKAVREFAHYISVNREFIPNYGDRWRNQERISSGFVESAVNQVMSKRMVKKQQMRWSRRGAHLLLQVRGQVLNKVLRGVFHGWYPEFETAARRQKSAA